MLSLVLPLLALNVAAEAEPNPRTKQKPAANQSVTSTVAPTATVDTIPTTNLSLLPMAATPDGIVIFLDESSIQPTGKGVGQINFRMLSVSKKPAAGKPLGSWTQMLAECNRDSQMQVLSLTPLIDGVSTTNGTAVPVTSKMQAIAAGTIPAAVYRTACENIPAIYPGTRVTALGSLKSYMTSQDVGKLVATPPTASYPKAPVGKARLYNPNLDSRTAYSGRGAEPDTIWFDMGSIERFGDFAFVWKLHVLPNFKEANAYWQRAAYNCKTREAKIVGVADLSPSLAPAAYHPWSAVMRNLNSMEYRDKVHFPTIAACLQKAQLTEYAAKTYPLVDISETINKEHQRMLAGQK